MILLSVFDYLNAATFFDWFIQNASYLFVFVFMVIESSFIPFPSEVVVPPAVYVGLHNGTMDPVMVVVVATTGALVGALVNYYLAMWLGRPIVYGFANSRLGHACLITSEKVENAERYFDKHGAISTFIGRLIPAIRQLISIPAGLAKMNLGKFVVFTALGAAVWNSILASLGYWLSKMVPLEDLYFQVEKYNSYLTIGGLCLLGLCVLFILFKALTTKRTKI